MLRHLDFIHKYFDNSDNVLALIEDLDLFPAELITPSVELVWRDKFLSEFSAKPFDDFTKDYLLNLSLQYQKLNHSKRYKGTSLMSAGQLKLF